MRSLREIRGFHCAVKHHFEQLLDAALKWVCANRGNPSYAKMGSIPVTLWESL